MRTGFCRFNFGFDIVENRVFPFSPGLVNYNRSQLFVLQDFDEKFVFLLEFQAFALRKSQKISTKPIFNFNLITNNQFKFILTTYQTINFIHNLIATICILCNSNTLCNQNCKKVSNCIKSIYPILIQVFEHLLE